MIGQYLQLVFSKVFRPTFRATDIIGFAGPPVIAAFQHARGQSAPDPADLLPIIGYIALAIFLLRVLTAPYFVWRDDQQALSGLREDMRRPERLMRERIFSQLADDRLRLADRIARIGNAVRDYEAQSPGKAQRLTAFRDLISMTDHLEERFMDNPEFRDMWGRFFTEGLSYLIRVPYRGDFQTHDKFLEAVLAADDDEFHDAYRALVVWLVTPAEVSPET